MVKKHMLLHDKIARKIFKSDDIGLKYTAKIVSQVLDEDYEEILKNLTPIPDRISISSLIINSETDALYQNDTMYIDLEINYEYGPYRKAQEFSYLCQLYLGQIKTNKDYTNVKKVVQIIIENYDFFHRGEFIYKVVFKEENLNLIEDSNFVKYHISLDYLDKLDYNNIIRSDHELERLLYFLVCGNDVLLKVYKGDTFMCDVIKKAKQIAGEEELPLYLSNDEITKLDREYHKNEGKKEMIINMYNENINIDTISKCSNLSIDEIKKIINEKKE